jgi:hypothetical protein
MAQEEQDREDLMDEATALVERAEIEIDGFLASVVCGFRRNGELSLFLGADPVYQFNGRNQLRRAFVDNVLYKAEQGRLIALRRERSAGSICLVRRDLSAEDTFKFMELLHANLLRLKSALTDAQYRLIQQVPTNAQVIRRVQEWLANNTEDLSIASSPRVG